jgi:hypothetical protein
VIDQIKLCYTQMKRNFNKLIFVLLIVCSVSSTIYLNTRPQGNLVDAGIQNLSPLTETIESADRQHNFKTFIIFIFKSIVL